MPESREKLYKALSGQFDLGSFDEFNKKMDNSESRKKLYSAVSKDFDLGSFNEFESKIKSSKGALGIFDDVANVMKQDPSIKKKSTTVSLSEQNQEGVSSGTSTMATKKPSGSSGSVDKRKSALDTFDEIGKVFEPYSAESKYKQRQKELKKDINKAEIKKDLSEQEMADALGWDKEDIKKATAGTGASKLTPAMAKPNVITPKGEGFSDKSQRNTVKAYQDLGKNANQEKIQERKKYYDVVDNQKYLKDQGYDVDINGKSDDEKTLRAIKKDQAKSKVIEQEAIKAADVDNKIDSIINEDLLKNEEEEAVVKLRKNFSKDGFYFEESGLGDNIIVEFRPDGITASKRIEIPFDKGAANNFFADKLNAFMKQTYMTKSEKNELNNADDLGKVIKLMSSNPYKYGEELIDEDLKENFLENRNRQINQERKSLQLEYKDLESKINNYNANPDPVEKKYIDNKMHELSLKEYKLNERDHDVRNIEKNYSKAAAVYYKGKEEKGNLLGNIASGFASGITNIQKAGLEEAADLLPSVLGAENVFNPVQYQQMKDEGMSDDDIMDYASKELKRGVLENIKDGIIDVSSLGSTTKEYKSSEDRGVLENVGNFLAESIGTSLSGGGNPGLTRLAFFTQSYNGMKDQMVGEEFDGLSEGEKTLIAVPYGLVVGALEKFGYDASLGFSKSGVFNKTINGILRKTLTELPKDATVETLKRTVNAEVSNLVKSGAIKIAAGSIAEGTVEGMQSLAETSTKNIVNQLYDKDLFKGVPDLTTKKGVMEALDMAKTDAAYGALGGLIMSGASISNQTYKQAKFNETSDYNFDLFYNSMMDDKLRKSIEYNTKLKVKNGELTKEEALEEIESIRKNTGVLKTIPTELSNRDKKESFNLILEKQKLETEIEGKNDNLVAPKKARIEEINNELKTIGENATKESSAIPSEISDLKDDEEVSLTVGTIDEVPEEFRDRAIKNGGRDYEVRKIILGLPIGKKQNIKTEESYTYKLTGKEAKDYAIKESNKQENGTESDIVQREGVNVGQQEVGQGEGSQRETAQPSADTSDSNISSQEEKVVEEPIAVTTPITQQLVSEVTTEEATQPAIDKEVEAIGEFITGSNAEIDQKVSRIKNKRIARSVSRAAKALSNVLPEVKIKVHATQEEYNQAVGDKGKFSNGKFDSKTNIIHINSANANARTVAHEVFHAVLLNKVKTNANAQDITKKLVDAVAKKIDKNPALKKYLDDFSSQYESNLQNEEKLAEFIGKLAENYNSFTTPIKDIITRWINKLADMFGLERTNDTYDALKTIAGKIASGKEITESDVEIIPYSEEIADANSRFQADFIDPASKVEFVYDKNTEKFKALEEEGYITKDKSISDFNGKTIFLHQPDAAFSGMIYKNGELLVEGKGGVYYPIKFHEDGYFWASTKSAAEKMAKDLNKVYKENGGKILMALTTAPSNKLLSSTTASNGVMEIIISKAFDKNFSINQTQVKQSLLDAANKFVIRKTAIVDKNTKEPILDSKGNKQYRMKEVGLKLNLKPSLSIDDIKSEISKKLDPDKSSFDDRKFFAESLISNVANIIKENPKAEDQFVKFFSEGIKNESFKASPRSKKDGGGFKISATNLKQGISEMLTEPLLKTGVDRTKGGQVYAILEVDGMVKDVDSDKHESYPKAIEADGKVKLHILTDRVTWSDVFEDFKTKKIVTEDRFKKVYPSSGVSVRGLKLNTDSLSRDQLNIDDTVKKLKDQGFTDAAIKKYLENQGIKGSQSQEAIRRYNAVKDNVFLNDPKTGLPKIAQYIKKWSNDQLTTKGNRPNSMFEAQEDMEGVIASHLNKVVRISKDFNKVYNAIPKNLREKFLEDYDSYLRGEQTVDISDDAKIVANEMRNQIDALSQNIIDAGLAPLGVEEEIRNNLGSYLTRSYEVFKNKDYKAKEEIVQRAKNFLQQQYLKEATQLAKENNTEVDFELNRLVNNKIDDLTNRIGADDFVGGGKLGSKSKELGVFKEKTDIPIEIRQLMGEFTDPVQNYAETVVKLSALAAKNDFLNKIKDAGMGVYLFTEKSRPEGYNVMIAAPGSDAMNPLNGLYTTPEIAKEFNNLPADLGKILKVYMKAISLIKWGKTIGSIMTHGKNLFGNLGFIAVNGHTSGAGSAFKAIRSDFNNSSDADMRKRIDNYIKLGIMKQSAGIGEIRDMFKDADFDKSLAERLSKRPSIKKQPIRTVASKVNVARKSVGSFLENLYQAEDDFFKILAYESELRRYAKAEFNKDINDLTDTERTKVDEIVANIVKDTMPTFSRIPKIVKALRKSPLLGNFISFQAESYRTAFKTIQLAKNEITSKNPAIRAIGARRIVGATIYFSSRTALLSYYGSAFGMGLAGLAGYFGDDDEEKEVEKDLRKFLPSWATQSDIIPTKNADGKITYVDMSAADPHGGISKALNAFFSGDNPIDGAKEAMFSIFKPFLEPEMTAKALFNLMSGDDNYDRPIWNSEDDWNGIVGDIGAFVFGVAQPGTVTSAIRIAKSEEKLNELVGGLTGYRPVKVDIGESFGYRIYDYKDRLDKAKKLYTNVSYKEDSTDEQKEKALEKANLKTEEIYKQLMEDYNSAERLGVESSKLRAELKDKLNLSVVNLKRLLSGGSVSIKPSRNNPD
jgi:hypothetical protein